MSGPSTPLPMGVPPQPKQMSSRLLTMKFMQRASNSNRTPSQPTTPASEPAQKKRKTDHTPDSSGTNTPTTDSKVFASRTDLNAALRAEAELEALAAARRAELGYADNTFETQWVLDVNIPSANGTAQAEEFSDEEADIWAEPSGRQIYGSYKRKKTSDPSKTSTPGNKTNAIDLDSVSDGDEDDDDDDDDDGSDEGEISSGDDYSQGKKTPSRPGHKRKAGAVDYSDQATLAALDKVDLASSAYARAKGTNAYHPPRNSSESRPQPSPHGRKHKPHKKQKKR